MAKTMRRPVDKVERQQRLASKQKNHDQRPGRIRPEDWAEFQDENTVEEEYGSIEDSII